MFSKRRPNKPPKEGETTIFDIPYDCLGVVVEFLRGIYEIRSLMTCCKEFYDFFMRYKIRRKAVVCPNFKMKIRRDLTFVKYVRVKSIYAGVVRDDNLKVFPNLTHLQIESSKILTSKIFEYFPNLEVFEFLGGRFSLRNPEYHSLSPKIRVVRIRSNDYRKTNANEEHEIWSYKIWRNLRIVVKDERWKEYLEDMDSESSNDTNKKDTFRFRFIEKYGKKGDSICKWNEWGNKNIEEQYNGIDTFSNLLLKRTKLRILELFKFEFLRNDLLFLRNMKTQLTRLRILILRDCLCADDFKYLRLPDSLEELHLEGLFFHTCSGKIAIYNLNFFEGFNLPRNLRKFVLSDQCSYVTPNIRVSHKLLEALVKNKKTQQHQVRECVFSHFEFKKQHIRNITSIVFPELEKLTLKLEGSFGNEEIKELLKMKNLKSVKFSRSALGTTLHGEWLEEMFRQEGGFTEIGGVKFIFC